MPAFLWCELPGRVALQILHGQAIGLGRRQQGDAARRRQARRLQPALHPLVGEAQAPVLVLLAQEFQAVRREVDDQQTSGRRHQTRRLGHGGGRIGQVVQHLVNHNQVGVAGGQARGEDIPVAQLAMLQAGLGTSGSGRC